MNRNLSLVLALLAGGCLVGCETSAGGFRRAFGVGSGSAKVGDQREMSSLSSLAVDVSQEFNLPRAGGSPVYAMQPSDSAQDEYFLVETFPREGITIAQIRKQLAELQSLSSDLRRKQQQVQAEAVALAETRERTLKVEEDRNKNLSDLSKAIKSLKPEEAAAMPLEKFAAPAALAATTDTKTLASLQNEASKALDAFNVKEKELTETLSRGNVLIVDWNQLGGGALTGTIGPIGVNASGNSRAEGIAILNGFRKIRKVSKDSPYDPKAPGNEPFGDNFERPRDATYILQAEEVMYFALDGSEFKGGVKVDPTKPSTGGWDAGGTFDVNRLQQYANFGVLRTPKVERLLPAKMTTEYSSGWVTVQIVGTPRYGMPRQQAPGSNR